MKDYSTVAKPGNSLYEEKRSKFLGNAEPCDSEETATAALETLRSRYWDAKHIVYAYRLLDGTTRFSDDGEPHGTAGKPVLDALVGSGLTSTLVTVTRYFGGTLLGTGGLVHAYSTAATEALKNATVAKMCLCNYYRVVCSYGDLERLNRVIADCNGVVGQTDFAAEVLVEFSVKAADAPHLLETVRETFSARLTVREEKTDFTAFLCEK